MMDKAKRAAMLLASSTRPLREVVNRRYLAMTPEQRAAFYQRYAKIHRNVHVPVQAGDWVVHFLGHEIRVPLTRERMWLDWDLAASFVAHDYEVTKTYETLLTAANPPTMFLDVGANYGTHSVLVASHGVAVVAFEPNGACVDYGKALSSANRVPVRWIHAAVGEEQGTIDLSYPERDTWLGALGAPLEHTTDGGDVVVEKVDLVTLDDYVQDAAGHRVLVKLDVEGYELPVLRGARSLMATASPTIIFEANEVGDRRAMFDLLRAADYRVLRLPWLGEGIALSADEFVENTETNFIALPGQHEGGE